MKCSFKTKNAKVRTMCAITIVVVLVALFLFVLNFILIQPAKFPIVEKDTTSAVWLQFWGGFITAFGTLILAYYTWNTIREENHRFRCDLEKQNYDILEKSIIMNEKIHNFEHIKYIVNTYLSEGYAPAQKIYLDLLLEVQSAGNAIVRFNNHQDENYRQYGERLSNLNKRFFILLLILRSRIEWHENIIINLDHDEYYKYLLLHGINYGQEEKTNDLHTYIEFAENYYNQTDMQQYPYYQMCKLGNELLQQHYKSFVKEIQKLKI